MKSIDRNGILLIVVFVITSIGFGCIQNGGKASKLTKESDTNTIADRYTMDDFKRVRKIDVHAHINIESKKMINMARANNFKLLNVAVSFSGRQALEEQLRVRMKHFNENPETIVFGTAFTLENWDDPDWAEQTIKWLKADFDNGAVAVKVWKNIGMEIRDKGGDLIVLSDPKLDKIFQFIKDQGIVLMSHAGEPKNCWLPLDSMTVKNDYDYFKAHPKYHMYLHPEMPSYQDQINYRDEMLAKNTDLKFIGVHMASLEWSVEEASRFLDRFPNASLDLAERVSHTQYQSQRDRKKVRDFFIKYQDRIIYGTDFSESKENLEAYMMEVWMNDWKYFNTEEMVTVPQLDNPVKGLALPKKVVDKIYALNAENLFPIFKRI
ncbi:amidohydrolase family protein [Reichenbachiella sp. MALMAid0571]|uniref:amidohydrolase family protein n=1 Tax=Reichenbachiella sp. MALMAid0571 TaxID=3143939 RepID=UPI0032DED172